MKRFKRIIMIALAILVGVAAVIAPTAPATAADAGSSASLSIVPKKNYVIEPGKSVQDKLTIRNLDTTSPLELSLRVIDFTFSDDGGAPKLFLAEDAPQTTWSLKPFLKVPQTVTIPPRESKTVDMSVSVPAGHGAGSYYSAILYSSGAPGDGGNVGLNASGVTLVFTQIPGQVKEDLKLEKLGAYFDNGGFKLFTAQEPQKIGYTLKNSGNVTESPAGSIVLTDLFGRKTNIDRVNPNSSLALIGQTRTFASCIKSKSQDVNFNGERSEANNCVAPGLWPGFYKISMDLYYGQNGNPTKEIVGNAWFFYMPLWFIIVLVIVLLVAAWYIRKLVLKIQDRRNGGVKLSRTPMRPTRRR